MKTDSFNVDYFNLALNVSREQARRCADALRQEETPNESPANNDAESDGA